MRVKCKACGWESLDYNDAQDLATTLHLLGGNMVMGYWKDKPDGWEITCPNRCEKHYTELVCAEVVTDLF